MFWRRETTSILQVSYGLLCFASYRSHHSSSFIGVRMGCAWRQSGASRGLGDFELKGLSGRIVALRSSGGMIIVQQTIVIKMDHIAISRQSISTCLKRESGLGPWETGIMKTCSGPLSCGVLVNHVLGCRETVIVRQPFRKFWLLSTAECQASRVPWWSVCQWKLLFVGHYKLSIASESFIWIS